MDHKARDIFIKCAYIVLDALSLALAIFIASCLRHSSLKFSVTFYNLFFSTINPVRFIFIFWILITIFLNNNYGLYRTKRELLEGVEIWQVIKSVFLSTLITIVAIYLARMYEFPRSIVGWTFFFTFTFSSFWRICKHFFVDWLVSSGYNNFNALIIGAGKVGLMLAQEIKNRPRLGIRVVGFLDDFKEMDLESKTNKILILGKISDFPRIAREYFINKIFITVHHDSRVFLQLLEQAKELRIAVRVVPQGFDLMSGEFSKYNIGLVPILEYCDEERLYKQAGKRLFDFIVSLIAVIFLIPVFLIVIILVKLDSHGGAFYMSRRYSRKGRIFNMYKFRTMVKDADVLLQELRNKNEVDGPIFKMREDPRITKFGKFLRKYSLDELPQLFNVLKGDMSLVGPRPLPIDQIEKEDLRQLDRLEVRPGITGLWQIRGRSDVSFSRFVKWDIWYIKNWSFWLDMTILFQTFPVVLRGKGAY